MTEENVELVRRAYDAFGARNIEGLLDLVHPEVDWVPITALVAGGQRYQGRYGVGEWYRFVTVNWADYRQQPTELRGVGDYVLALGTVLTQTRADEPHEELLAGWIWRIEEGLIVSMHAYLDQRKALDALKELTRGESDGLAGGPGATGASPEGAGPIGPS
jgi:ketosteroid isomerase-like protein